MLDNMPLRAARSFSDLTNEKLDEIVAALNAMQEERVDRMPWCEAVSSHHGILIV